MVQNNNSTAKIFCLEVGVPASNQVHWSECLGSYCYTDVKGFLHTVSPIRQYNPHEGDYYTVLDEVLTINGYRM